VDPRRSDRMLICSMAIDPARNRLSSVLYRSETGGATWQLAFDDTVSQFGQSWDPTCAFAPDGTAYLSDLWLPPPQANVPRSVTALHKSVEGQARWSGPQLLPLLHNPYLTIDHESQAYPGRIYIVGVRDLPDSSRRSSAPSVIYSDDRGTTFRTPVDLID